MKIEEREKVVSEMNKTISVIKIDLFNWHESSKAMKNKHERLKIDLDDIVKKFQKNQQLITKQLQTN